MRDEDFDSAIRPVPLWQPMAFGAMAGGLAWGIRGQYGHETGAMVAGLLVSSTLIFILCPGISALRAARAIALCTIAMGIGGSMTYGQTVGLTHDREIVGNWGALGWGMLGLAIKGGTWIGIAGLFLGIGLGGKRYTSLEMLKLVLAMLFAALVGWSLLNRPHDPANMRLPFFYFSDHWYWEPDIVGKVKHRPEVYGGLLAALLTAAIYASRVKKDGLARNLALWGVLAGALGFPLGQSLQTIQSWNPDFFRESFAAPFTNYLNWWNTMETGFGTVMGAVLGAGLYFNRSKIDRSAEEGASSLPHWLEGLLLTIHIPLLVAMTFVGGDVADAFYDFGLVLCLIPLVACIQGRYWPFLMILPVTLLPIAGKTARMIIMHGGDTIEVGVAFSLLFLLPMVASIAFAVHGARSSTNGLAQPTFVRDVLLFTTWAYFWLNHTFFDFPWPWLDWGGRTANGLIFTFYALGITGLVYSRRFRTADGETSAISTNSS